MFSLRANQTAFDFSGTIESMPTETQAALRQRDSQALIPSGSSFIDYIRGMDPVRNARGAMLRLRLNPMGAIVNSTPLFVGADEAMAYDLIGNIEGRSSYGAYRDRLRAAPKSLIVATNAGMVHQLEAANGREQAVYLPRRVMPRLIGNADPTAEFAYVLDGPLSLNEVFSGGQWQQIVTGTGGRGERLIYGLRIPVNGTQPRTIQASDVLWEVGPDTVNNANVALGHLTNPMRSGQTVGGRWVLITTTGHHNGHGDGSRHGLVVLDPTTGAVIRSIALPLNHPAGRGLGGVTLLRDRDQRIVAAFAGDANGQLWRFDLRGAPSDWRVSYNQPLFITAANRPIFGAPALQPHPRGGTMVVVATGMALDETDLGDLATNESVYGIWDPTPRGEPDATGFAPIQNTQLLVQGVESLVQTTEDGRTYSATTSRTIDWAQHRGWRLALGHAHRGERAIDQIRNVSNSVLINTTVIQPAGRRSESCSAIRPANYLYVLRALDGAGRPAFDIDDDGRLEPVSMAYLPSGGFNTNIGVTFRNADNSISRDLMSLLNAGLRGESSAITPNDRDLRLIITGTTREPVDAGSDADKSNPDDPLGRSRPWSRQQYQLSRPPQ